MRLLLCDLETGDFYRNPRLWVQTPDEAAAFADMECLLAACEQLPRATLAVIALDDDGRPRYCVRLWYFAIPKAGP